MFTRYHTKTDEADLFASCPFGGPIAGSDYFMLFFQAFPYLYVPYDDDLPTDNQGGKC
jgi:hypothetical protein